MKHRCEILLCVILAGFIILKPLCTSTLFWIPSSLSIRPAIYMRTWPTFPLSYYDIVIFRPPRRAWVMLEKIGVDGEHDTMMKSVSALAGDWVCYLGNTLFVNGSQVATLLATTRKGESIERTEHGCRRLEPEEFLPLSTWHAQSFDGRYFGAVSYKAIVARVKPIVPLPEWVYTDGDRP